jgi:hypothetical protein
MFERFTDHARRAVVRAQEEGSRLRHQHIGTEHLLLGLLRESQDATARALEAEGATLDSARAKTEAIVGRGAKEPSGHIPFTARAKSALERSMRESNELGDGNIGTGHLLLGLIGEGDDTAAQILGQLGVDLSRLRDRMVRELTTHPESPDDPVVPSLTSTYPGFPRSLAPDFLTRQARLPIHALLERIDHRLSAIEVHLGIATQVPAEIRQYDRDIARVRRETAGAGGAASAGATGEAARLQAEIARLRTRLREHDIDPGEPGMPTG